MNPSEQAIENEYYQSGLSKRTCSCGRELDKVQYREHMLQLIHNTKVTN